MKLLFENWRRYVKEARDRPVPFQTLHSLESGPSVQGRYKKTPSVGYGQVEQPEFVQSVKTLFNKTKDNWVIIVLDDTHETKKELDKDYFKQWLESKKESYPKDAKILIVGSHAYQGDFTSPEWIVHDILGHTAGRAYLNNKNFNYNGPNEWLERTKGVSRMIMIVHSYLVRNSHPVSNSDMLFDMVYDIFASIILNDLTREDLEEMPNLDDEQKAIMNEIFNFCDSWVSSIPSDNTKVTVLELW